jgi:hypothetical protein
VTAALTGTAAGAAIDRGRMRAATAQDTLSAIRVLVIFVAFAQLGDVLSTDHVLSAHAGAYEANPVTRLVMAHLGAGWWLPKAVFAGLILYAAALLQHPSRPLFLVAAGIAGFHALVLINNLLNF